MSSAFRITQRTLSSSTLAGLQANLARLQETQAKMSSGRAIQRPSDSPTGTMTALRLRSDLDRYAQLDRNADDAKARLGTADTALTDGLSALREVRDAVLQGANGSLSQNDREALASQVDGLRSSLVGVANTTYLQQPIFAGTAGASTAYDASGVYQGDGGGILRSIAPGVKVSVNATGPDVFGPAGNDIFKVLSDISADLRTNPGNLTTVDLGKLDAGYLRMQNALATVGSRYHQIEIMQARNNATQLESQNQLSEVEGVDLPATMVELQLQEVAYQAALGATAKVIQPSLVDFLR
ncbi:MAG: flagellar hook-associated protein 3 FlgL [Actinomycetota bacterium]|jgi:flagellar hook-associated protein 3 FlgL|nr:flagellar hook-associated protein 3 FlgL [Actinomycetota bacterium]